MVDELLRDFLDGLFARYQEIVDAEPNPLDVSRACSWPRSRPSSTGTPRS